MKRWWLVALLLPLCLVACRKTAELRGVKAAQADVEATVTTISTGTVDAEQQAVLGFGVTGRVSAIDVKAGERVTKGKVLAELENADLRITYQDAVKELTRSQKLFDSQLISRVALDNARRAMEVAKANLDKAVIRAPFDGVITEVNLELGEQAGPSGAKPLVRIIDLKPRIVKGDIDEVDLGKVTIGQKARVRIPASRVKPYEAVVSRTVPFVDTRKEQDRTSQIELTLEKTTELVPVGASAEIEIVIGKKTGVLAIPSRLILGTGGQRYVYRFSEGKLHKTPIEIGMGNYERTEVRSGLNVGDTVVYPSDEVEMKDGLGAEVKLTPWP